jgi:outer membrane protein assembly factor BamB
MWGAMQGVSAIDPERIEAINELTQFKVQFMGPLVAALLVFGWWLFFSRLRWLDRLLVPLFVIGVITLVVLVGDRTAGMLLMFSGVPWLLTSWAGWLLLTPFLAWSLRRAGLLVGIALLLGYYALVRMDGISGTFVVERNWRWVPTREDKYDAVLAAARSTPRGDPTAPVSIEAQPGDWPAFRGPECNSRVEGVRLATDWDRQPPRELWRKQVGAGWGSFAVVGDLVYTQEQRRDREAVMCWEAATGNEVWVHEEKARFDEPIAGPGPRATPTYHAGKLYTLGGNGNLNCFNAGSGALLWSKDIVVESGRAQLPESDQRPMWGFASSPLVTHGLVVVFAGGTKEGAPANKALLAFDAQSGDLQWTTGSGGHSYCTAQLAKLSGIEQILMVTEQAVFAYEPATGAELWRFDWNFEDGQRCCQPAVLSDTDFLVGTPFTQGLKRVRVTRTDSTWTASDVWFTKGISPYFNDLVVHKDHLYGIDGKFLTCVSIEDGKRRWRVRGYDAGQVLLLPSEDLLLVVSEQGDLALVAASPEAHRELPGRFHALEGKTWNHPVVAHGRLYVRNGQEAVCYELPQ